jgi:hypothetical protein
MLLAITPPTNANAPTLLSQTIKLPRSERSASAVGEDSRRKRGAAVSCEGRRPLPRL